jgi:large subunit ribosomal protein L10
LTFADADVVATAKALKDFAKETDRLVVKGGLLGRVLLAPEQISRLADIEPREVLLAKIAGAARAPMAKAAGLFASFTRNAASMFSQLLEKKTAA